MDTGITGRSDHARAAALLVPSPPSTTTTAHPIDRIAATADTVSSSLKRIGSSTHTRSRPLIVSVARRTMSWGSRWTTNRFAPDSRAPNTTLRTALAFTSTVTVAAAATARRTSVPARGFTIRPIGATDAATAADRTGSRCVAPNGTGVGSNGR